MSQFTSIEVLGLKQLLDRYAQISELVDRLPQILDLVDPMGPLQPEPPQPVATLCEALEAFIPIQEKLVGADNEKWDEYDRALEIVKIALTAERKRAVLVENLIDAARRFYQENDGRYDLLRVRLSELDAFDKERGV